MNKSVNRPRRQLVSVRIGSRAGESCFARIRASDRLRNLFNLFAPFGRHHPFSSEVYLDSEKTGPLERVEFRPVAVQ